MKAKSHRTLGKYLADTYLPDVPRRYLFAFLTGCTQPDKNPTTYLKGSLHFQWLRGHNWSNAQRYMQKLAQRLEKRSKLNLLDYYTLGKLIHYTADAFTGPHNTHFPGNIQAHRIYEERLQVYFLEHLPSGRHTFAHSKEPIMDTIRTYHRQYATASVDIFQDCKYSILATSTVLHILSPKTA